jgi:hypothetical protein
MNMMHLPKEQLTSAFISLAIKTMRMNMMHLPKEQLSSAFISLAIKTMRMTTVMLAQRGKHISLHIHRIFKTMRMDDCDAYIAHQLPYPSHYQDDENDDCDAYQSTSAYISIAISSR